jgi:hypothetical protein
VSLADCGQQPFGALKGGKRKSLAPAGLFFSRCARIAEVAELLGLEARDLVAYSADVFR